MKLLWKIRHFIQLLLDEKIFMLVVSFLAICSIGAYMPFDDFGIRYVTIASVFFVGFLFPKYTKFKRWLQVAYENMGIHEPTKAMDNRLIRYSQIYDLDAMIRFWEWALARQGKEGNEFMTDSWIASNIAHDLNGISANPEIFSPQTARY